MQHLVTYEVDADGRDVGLGISVVGEPQEQARLADTGITDEQQLEQVVVSNMLSAVGCRDERKQRALQIWAVDRGSGRERKHWKRAGVLAANKGGRGAQLDVGAVSRSAYYSGFIVGGLQ